MLEAFRSSPALAHVWKLAAILFVAATVTVAHSSAASAIGFAPPDPCMEYDGSTGAA